MYVALRITQTLRGIRQGQVHTGDALPQWTEKNTGKYFRRTLSSRPTYSTSKEKHTRHGEAFEHRCDGRQMTTSTYCHDKNLPHLSPDEDVEAVAVLGIERARHRVEGSHFQRIFIHHEEVRSVFVGHEVTQLFLVLRRKVAIRISCDNRSNSSCGQEDADMQHNKRNVGAREFLWMITNT